MPHIEARDITLTYQTPSGAVPAVHGVSFGIETSEFLCIVGPSGCGKSTLLNIMAGFLTPSAGEIRIGGAPVTGYGMDRGVVFQDFAQLLAEVWRTTRKTVIYVTHNVAEAVYLADRVLVMTPHPGTVKTEVPIQLSRPRDPLSVEFLDYQKMLLRLLGQEREHESQQSKNPEREATELTK